MRGLGRLIALPFLLIALALQGLAPAQAEAMPRDAFGFPICSGAGHGHQQSPDHGQPHDCCAAACALAGLLGGPSPTPLITRAAFGVRVEPAQRRRVEAPTSVANRRPNARGPPPPSSTI